MDAEVYDLDLTLNEPVCSGGHDVMVSYEIQRGAGGSRFQEDPPDRDHLVILNVYQGGQSIYGDLPAEIHAEIAMAVREDWRVRKLNEAQPDVDEEGESL